jgi:four helix bundle protein
MSKQNLILDKTYAFSLRIIKLYRHLNDKEKFFPLSSQILRSGTSIGANAEEGNAGQSKKDFIAKMQVSYKEAKETHYWIRLLRDSQYIESTAAESLLNDCNEILRIINSILQTAKSDGK